MSRGGSTALPRSINRSRGCLSAEVADRPVVCHPHAMIRLQADAPGVALDEKQVLRIKFLLLEFLPADRCIVRAGPAIEILVPDRVPDDLTPHLRQRIEEIVGCPLSLSGGE